MASGVTARAGAAESDSLLRLALQINGVFSVVSGVACVAGAGWLAEQLGVGEPLVIAGLGLVIVAFAGLVLFMTTRRPLQRGFGLLIFTMDALWVVASLVLLFGNLLPLTDAGRWVVVAVTLVVAVIADLEFLGQRKMR